MAPGLLTLSLVAGAVAAVNPCGFAMLPAYLTLFVATPPAGGRDDPLAATGRALRFSLGMTTGFVLVFAAFGLIVTPLALSVERYLPVVTIAMGALLVVVGGWLLSGRSLAVPGVPRGGRGPTGRWLSQVGYGATFALTSLSCTIGPFLAVTATALRAGGTWKLSVALVVYALGMGIVVLGASLAVASAGNLAVRGLRRAAPLIGRASGALVLLAGGYVAWYGWFELRTLSGTVSNDPVVDAVTGAQAALTRAVTGLGSTGLLLIGAACAAMLLIVGMLARRRARQVSRRAVARR